MFFGCILNLSRTSQARILFQEIFMLHINDKMIVNGSGFDLLLRYRPLKIRIKIISNFVNYEAG